MVSLRVLFIVSLVDNQAEQYDSYNVSRMVFFIDDIPRVIQLLNPMGTSGHVDNQVVKVNLLLIRNSLLDYMRKNETYSLVSLVTTIEIADTANHRERT